MKKNVFTTTDCRKPPAYSRWRRRFNETDNWVEIIQQNTNLLPSNSWAQLDPHISLLSSQSSPQAVTRLATILSLLTIQLKDLPLSTESTAFVTQCIITVAQKKHDHHIKEVDELLQTLTSISDPLQKAQRHVQIASILKQSSQELNETISSIKDQASSKFLEQFANHSQQQSYDHYVQAQQALQKGLEAVDFSGGEHMEIQSKLHSCHDIILYSLQLEMTNADDSCVNILNLCTIYFNHIKILLVSILPLSAQDANNLIARPQGLYATIQRCVTMTLKALFAACNSNIKRLLLIRFVTIMPRINNGPMNENQIPVTIQTMLLTVFFPPLIEHWQSNCDIEESPPPTPSSSTFDISPPPSPSEHSTMPHSMEFVILDPAAEQQ